MARRNVGSLVVNVLLNAARFETGLKRMSRSLARSGRRLQSTGRALTTGFTLPIVAAGFAATKMAVDFDDSMTKIVSLVGIARGQVDAWREDLLRLAKETGRVPAELADGLFFVTSAGFRGAEALEVLRNSAMASAAGLGATAVVADAVTSAINAYGAANLSSAKATGILVAAVREGKASAEDLAPVLGRIIPLAAELDVGFDEVGAALAALTRVSGSATQASTALRGILSKIIKPTEAAKKELAAVGLSMDGIRRSLIEKGLLRTLIDLRKTFEGNTEALGKIFEDVEALNGVLILTGSNAAATEKIFASLAKETGQSLVAAFEAVKESAGFKFRQALAGTQAILIRFGALVLPLILPQLEKMVTLSEILSRAFFSLSDSTQKNMLIFVGLVAVIGPLIAVLGFLLSAIGAIVTPFVLAATLLAGAGILVFQTWDKIVEGLGIIFDQIVSLAKAASTRLVEEWESAKTKLKGIFDKIVDASRTTFEKIMQNKVVKAAISANAAITDLAAGTARLAGELGIIEAKAGKASGGLMLVGGAADVAKVLVVGAAQEMRDNFVQGFRDMINSAVAFAEGLGSGAEKIRADFQNLRDDANKAFDSLKDGMGAVAEKSTIFSEITDNSLEKIKGSLKGLALSGIRDLGSLTGELAKGIRSFEDFATAAKKAIQKVIIQMVALRAFGPIGGTFAGGFVSGFFGDGGRPPAGRAAIVGEKGPEIFVPDTAGTITPLSELGVAGGITVNLTQVFDVQAMDFSSREMAKKVLRMIGKEAKRGGVEGVTAARRLQDTNDINPGRAA